MKKRSLQYFIISFLFLSLIGCQYQNLHHNLDENSADQILAALHRSGIKSRKKKEVSGQDVSWTVQVLSGQTAEARQILIDQNMPRKKELGLSGVYQEKGLIPTPDEQQARFLLALKGEIINSLESIPGVVDADVVLNIPRKSEFSELEEEEQRPTVAVVVRIHEGSEATDLPEGKIQRFVANSVPNLDPNDVTVIMSVTRRVDIASPSLGPLPDDLPEGDDFPGNVPAGAIVSTGPNNVNIAGLQMDAQSRGRFKLYAIIFLVVLILIAGALLINVFRFNQYRRRVESEPLALEEGQQNQGLIGGGPFGGSPPDGPPPGAMG
jgi:type III secretion system YscJ/HrcJ family lipoprotein